MAEAFGNIVYNWRSRITSEVVASDNGSATISTTTYFQSINNWQYAGLSGSFNAAVGDQESYGTSQNGITVSTNGIQQLITKDLTVSKTHTAQNILVSGYVNITGYYAGKSYATQYLSIPAKPSWIIKFDANGGNNAPGNITKWWGESVSIPTQIPSKTNYEFLGWNSSGTADGNYYKPGQTYDVNQNITLKACWKLKSNPPTISSFNVYRSDSSGTIQNDGTYITFITEWSVDTTIDSSNSLSSLVYSYNDGTTWHSYDASASSGTSGTTKAIFSGYDIYKKYLLSVNVTDKYSNIYSERTVGPASFIFDFTSDGQGIGIGQAAPESGVAIYGNPLTLNGGSPIITTSGNIPSKTDSFAANKWYYEDLEDGRVHLYGLFQQTGGATYHFTGLDYPFNIRAVYSLSVTISQSNAPNSTNGYCRSYTSSLDAYGINGNGNNQWWLYANIIGYRA